MGYLQNRYDDYAEFKKTQEEDNRSYLDTFSVKKQTYSVQGQIGYQFNYKNWYLDMGLCVGPRYRNIQEYNRNNPEGLLINDFPKTKFYSNREKEGWSDKVEFQLAVGWNI